MIALAKLKQLRAHWAEQVSFEKDRPSRRALKAMDVLGALDELLRVYRRNEILKDVLSDPPDVDHAISKLVTACAPGANQDACCALRALSQAGWKLECMVEDRGFTVIARKPKQGGA